MDKSTFEAKAKDLLCSTEEKDYPLVQALLLVAQALNEIAELIKSK